MSLTEILKKVALWRLAILLLAVLATFLIAPRTRFTNLSSSPSWGNLASMWSNFDGVHYLDIAEYGYGYSNKTDADYAFFPVYPWLINKLSFGKYYLASGLFISHLCLVLALYFLYRLVRLDYNPQISRRVIFYLLLFPAAFFFGTVYNESLFLLLAVLSFYSARKKNFFLACVFAAIASATRVTGIFLWLSLAYEFYLAHGKSIRKCLGPQLIWLTLPPLGLLSYMRFQFLHANDPLYFVHIQSSFAERTVDKVILLYQVFYRYFKMLIFVDHADPLFFTVLIEFLAGLLILLVLIFSIKKMRPSYWVFVFFSYILPSLTGTFMSLPRFMLVLFPVFIFLADWLERHHPYYRYLYCFLSVLFSILMISLFTRGYFVS